MHDNARPHVSEITNDFLASKLIKCIKQPPYSPDVNLLDRFFFPLCEIRRSRESFNNAEEVLNFIVACSSSLNIEILKHEYEKLIFTCKKIIDVDGNYI